MTRRKSLSRAQKVRIFDAASGRCHICRLKIQTGERWEADHVVPRAFTGSDAIEEYKPAHVACHKLKSKGDNRAAKKSTRQRANHLGVKKLGRPIPGSRASGWKKTFMHGWIRRDA